MPIFDDLLKIGTLTGSRAFGTNNDKSDYDIVIPISRKEEMDYISNGLERRASEYSNGFYIECEGKIINLILVHDESYAPWCLATKAMISVLKESGIVSARKKYAIFEGFVALFKAAL